MITKDEIQELLHSTETYRVERTTSTGDMDKFQEAICAFANDNGGKNGGDVPNLSQVLSPDEEKDASIDAKDATSSSKVATSDEKVASSGLKDATLKKKISSEEMAIYILEYCSTWRTMDEIAQFANRDKNYIRNKVLPRLAEKLEKEHPDVPNHPRQRYRTIAKDQQGFQNEECIIHIDYGVALAIDPASEDDMEDNGMSRYMENNDEEGWD